MSDLERSTPAYHKVLLAKHSMPGLVLGTIMLWFSLGSSLLPRAAMMQGVVSALSFVFGYGIGVLLWYFARWVGRLFGKNLSCDIAPGWLRLTFLGITGAVLAVTILRWPAWQSEQRLLVGLEEIGIADGLMAVVWTFVFVALLMFIGRSLMWVIWKLDVFNGRHTSGLVGRGITVVILAGIFGALYWFIASSGLTTFANERFGPGDETTLEG
ncbi:MAG: alpha/beta-hydrolase N-terminal domain-containing protein, partial [Acidimicrobiia bacterium]